MKSEPALELQTGSFSCAVVAGKFLTGWVEGEGERGVIYLSLALSSSVASPVLLSRLPNWRRTFVTPSRVREYGGWGG